MSMRETAEQPAAAPPIRQGAAKRLVDVALSSTALLLGLPLWALVAVLIRADSPGPVFYLQERVGQGGRRFTMIKFRSMRRDAEDAGPRWSGPADPRVTRVGRLLRRWHLDEAPQTLNVLRGEMSLVGPRPERPVFFERLAREIPGYERRVAVRPGVTGWAQVNLKADETLEDVRRKLDCDLHYVENASLALDARILARTLVGLLRGRLTG